MSTRNLFELILLAAIWGSSFLFMRIATPEFGAVVLIELRVLLASLVLLPIWYLTSAKPSDKTVRLYWKPLLVVGALNSAIPFVLFAYSTLYITGGYASMLNATAPLWGALVAWAWLKKTPSLDASLGLLMGLAGVTLLVSNSLSLSITGVSLGIFAGLFASFLYGVAANYTAVKLTKVSPLAIATFSQIAAAVILLPPAVVMYPLGQIFFVGMVICVSSWSSVYKFSLYTVFSIIANMGSSKAITVTFLIPIFGTFWGAVFLNEAITIEMILGSGVILLGTLLVTGFISFRKLTK